MVAKHRGLDEEKTILGSHRERAKEKGERGFQQGTGSGNSFLGQCSRPQV